MNETIPKDIIRANPCYKKMEWFDWMKVEFKYFNANGGPPVKKIVPAQIFLWLSFSLGGIDDGRQVFGLIRALDKEDTEDYHMLDVLRWKSSTSTTMLFLLML